MAVSSVRKGRVLNAIVARGPHNMEFIVYKQKNISMKREVLIWTVFFFLCIEQVVENWVLHKRGKRTVCLKVAWNKAVIGR
jgi:hypothetical protein